MSKRDDKLLLEDIILSAQRIKEYTSLYDFKDFQKDYKTIDAVVRNFEIIGEASNRLSIKVREMSPETDWISVISFRNRMIHEYFGVDITLVWEIIEIHLDDLIQEINKILKVFK